MNVRALRSPDADTWRIPGCGERCQLYWVLLLGRRYHEQMPFHDPYHHYARGAYDRDAQRPVVRTANLVVDGDVFAARVDGEPVHLTAIETRLLIYLASQVGTVCTKGAILREVWGTEYAPLPGKIWRRGNSLEEKLIRVHMSRLRANLGTAGQLIETVLHVGYRLRDDPPVGEQP